MTVVEIAPVVKSIEVARSAADAFRIFTADIGAWWPTKTHTRAKTAAGEVTQGVTIEPRAGGRVYETLTDGRALEWGEVQAFQPGEMLSIVWRMRAKAEEWSLVTVRFEALGAARCRVTLTHDHWENLGPDAASARESYSNGWVKVFDECFARAAA